MKPFSILNDFLNSNSGVLLSQSSKKVVIPLFVCFMFFSSFNISYGQEDYNEIQSIVISSTDTLSLDENGNIKHLDVRRILGDYNLIRYEMAYPVAKTFKGQNCFEIILSNPSEYDELVDELENIASITEVIIVKEEIVACTNPVLINDPGIATSEGYYIDMANLPCAWDLTLGDPNIIIAIPDLFFDYTHDDLNSKIHSISLSCNPSLNVCDHGYAVAGAAAAIMDNNIAVAGSGGLSKVALYCVGTNCKGGSSSPGILAAYADGHKIISISFTNTLLARAMMEEIVESGVTVVHSTHGTGWSTVQDIPGVIGVGQVASDFNYYPYNVWEPNVDIYAPCLDVARLAALNSWAVGTGNTSFGAPLVAGIVALIKSVNPDLCPAEIEDIIELSNQGLPANASSWPLITAGIIDAEAAVIMAQSYGKFTISTNTNWTTDKVVNGLIIEPGAELLISNGATIKFAANAKVEVMRGARLIVDNSTLTVKECSGEKWRGIHLRGNYYQAQPNYNDPLVADQAGIIVIRNNSLVEKAHDAIHTIKYNESWNTDYWGGLVHAENSTFTGNTRVTAFMKYDFTNKSKYFNCTFNGDTKGITIWDCDGITFNRCRFNDMTQQGIVSYDSKIIVLDENTFSKNSVGIRSISTFPFSGASEIGNVGINPNFFTQNFIDIESNASAYGAGLQIINNEFNASTTGILIEGPSRYTIKTNVFFSNNFGAFSYRTGSMGWAPHNFIRENSIIGKNGIYVEGENRELQFICNGFNTTNADFTLTGINTTNGEIKPIQGVPSYAAGNCFTNPGVNIDIQTISPTISFNYLITSQPCAIPLNPGNYITTSAIGGDICVEVGPGGGGSTMEILQF